MRIRHVYLLVMTITAILFLSTSTAWAATHVWLTVGAPSETPKENSTFSTDLVISSWNGAVGALDLCIKYDPSVLKLSSCSVPDSSPFDAKSYVISISNSTGVARIACIQVSEQSAWSESVAFAKLDWQVLGKTGIMTDIALEPMAVVDISWKPVEVYLYGQSISIGSSEAMEVRNLAITPGNSSLLVSWSDPIQANFSKARIYYKRAGQTNYGLPTEVIKGTQKCHIDGLVNGTSYQIKVTAVDSSGTESSGLEVMGVPQASNPGGGPSGGGGATPTTIIAPTNLEASSDASSIRLSWGKANDASKYNLYRKEGSGSYVKLSISPITDTVYTDSTAKAGISYTYYVTALSADMIESEKSNEVSAMLAVAGKKIIRMTIGQAQYSNNEAAYQMDVAPYIRSSRTYLPVRFVAESLGATVDWDSKTKTATITGKNGTVLILKIGSVYMTKNGTRVQMDVAPEIKSSRTMLPVRWVAEALGATVGWDGKHKQVTITMD